MHRQHPYGGYDERRSRDRAYRGAARPGQRGPYDGDFGDGALPESYAAPPPALSAPYGPPVTVSRPPPGYPAYPLGPPAGYGSPAANYGSPAANYGSPAASYAQPYGTAPAYAPPGPTGPYGVPTPGYGAPPADPYRPPPPGYGPPPPAPTGPMYGGGYSRSAPPPPLSGQPWGSDSYGSEPRGPPRRRGDYSGKVPVRAEGKERPNRTLFVRNFDFEANPEEVRQAFQQYGDVKTLFDLIHKRGITFITFYDLRAAIEAKRNLHGQTFGPSGRRGVDIHYNLPKPDDYKQPCTRSSNQGTIRVSLLHNGVIVRGLDDGRVRSSFEKHGDIKSIKEERAGYFVVDFWDSRAAVDAYDVLNHMDAAPGHTWDVALIWDVPGRDEEQARLTAAPDTRHRPGPERGVSGSTRSWGRPAPPGVATSPPRYDIPPRYDSAPRYEHESPYDLGPGYDQPPPAPWVRSGTTNPPSAAAPWARHAPINSPPAVAAPASASPAPAVPAAAPAPAASSEQTQKVQALLASLSSLKPAPSPQATAAGLVSAPVAPVSTDPPQVSSVPPLVASAPVGSPPTAPAAITTPPVAAPAPVPAPTAESTQKLLSLLQSQKAGTGQ